MTAFFVFIRIVSECALWFGFGGLILSLFTGVSEMTAALPVLGLCAAVCHLLGEKNRKLRFAGLPLLLGLVPFCRTVGDGLLLLPAVVYLADSVCRDKLRPDSTGVYYQFHTIAGICLVGCVFSIMGNKEWCFLCCVLSVVLYLFLSRMLRHRAADFRDRRLLAMELGLLVLVLLAAVVFSRRLLLNAALQLIKQLYFLIIYPILMVLVYLMIGIFAVLNRILALFLSDRIELPEMQMMQMLEGMPEMTGQAETGAANPLVMLLLRLLCAAAFLFVGYLVMRFLRKGAGDLDRRADSGDARRSLENDRDWNASAPPPLLDRSPEASVRRAYLSYCRWLKETGVKITRSDTSRSVNRLAYREGDPAATELRKLYLAARYTGRSGLTREDARRAAALVKEIKNDKTR